MKRNFAFIAALLLVCVCAFAAGASVSEAAGNYYVSIEVTTMPDKTTYVVGESFDMTGMKVTGVLNTGTRQVLGSGTISVSPTVLNTAGTAKVKVTANCVTSSSGTMGQLSTNINVTVVPSIWATGISVQTPPTQLEYSVGDSLNTAGMKVVAAYTYASGGTTTGDCTHECSFSPNKFTAAGTVTVTVECDLPDRDGSVWTFSTKFTVTVRETTAVTPEFTTSATLPSGTVGVEYSCYIKAKGTDVQIGQYFNPGGPNNMPDGLRFSTSGSGHLKGTPTKAGTYTFWAYASNDLGDDYRKFTVTIVEAGTTPEASPDGTAVVDPDATPTPDPDATPEFTAAPEPSGEPHVHTPGAEWERDETEHWHVCSVCGERCDAAGHTVEWSVIRAATEDADGAAVGICTVCGYTLTKTVPYEASSSGSLSLPLIIAIAGGGLLLTGGIVVLIILLAKKKRAA